MGRWDWRTDPVRGMCVTGNFFEDPISKMLGVILWLPCHGKQFEIIAQFNGVMLATLPPSR